MDSPSSTPTRRVSIQPARPHRNTGTPALLRAPAPSELDMARQLPRASRQPHSPDRPGPRECEADEVPGARTRRHRWGPNARTRRIRATQVSGHVPRETRANTTEESLDRGRAADTNTPASSRSRPPPSILLEPKCHRPPKWTYAVPHAARRPASRARASTIGVPAPHATRHEDVRNRRPTYAVAPTYVGAADVSRGGVVTMQCLRRRARLARQAETPRCRGRPAQLPPRAATWYR